MRVEILKNDTFGSSKDFPKQGTEKSSGYDVVAISKPNIVGQKSNNGLFWSSIDYIEYETGLHISPEVIKHSKHGAWYEDEFFDTLIFPRSSVSKYNLDLANAVGLIDNDYRNSIKFRFKYCWQPMDLLATVNGEVLGSVNDKKIYQKGDKIGQLKFTKVIPACFVLVDELGETDRGMGGFGSTGA